MGKEERIFVSPLARRIAEQEGIDLKSLKGSGPHGRIVKADVEGAPKGAAVATGAALPVGDDYEVVKLNAMRKTVARRMVEAKTTVPHFYLTRDIKLDALLEMRRQINERRDDVKLSVNDFLIKAAALALIKVPAANASFMGDVAHYHKHAHISVAVAIEGGLITPVIRAADVKGMVEISAEMKDLATRARDKKLMPEEYQGGTFSISNLGMFGIREFAAVINPPEGAILAVGAGEKRAVVEDDEMVIRTMMTVTMSCDHRVVDGAVGAEWLQAFAGFVEDPLSLLI